MANSAFGLIQTDPKKRFALQTAINPEDDQGAGGTTELPSANFSTVPTIASPTINTGQGASIRQANLPANFQWTGAYEAANRALAQEESDAGFARRSNIANVDQQYRDALARSGDLASIARTQLQENMATRGLMMSGINAQASGHQEKEYNYHLGELGKARANALSGVESNYAQILNELYRRREGLAMDQQKEEENRRLQEERLKAEAEARRVQQEQQAQMLAQIQAQTEAAQRAAAAAAAASQIPTYSPPALAGGGGGSYNYGQPQQQAPQGPPPGNIVMPQWGQGVTRQGVENWVRSNIDRNVTGEAMNQVINHLVKAGPMGIPLADIAWLIQQYPNTPTSGGDKQYAAGGGRRF